MELKYLLFCLSTDLFGIKDRKRNLTDGNLIRKCVGNLMLRFSWLEPFC